MRNLVKALWLVAAMAVAGAASQAAAPAAPSPAAPSFEIVKDHVDIEASADGSYAWSREESYRVLDTRGIELLHQRQLFYTQHFETFEIVAAYTLKANGQRIDVPKSGILSGYGLSSRPGFQDIVIVNVFFPNLEVGDTVMLETTRRQSIPWFAGQFDFRMELTRAVPMHDVHYTLTAPAAMRLVFDQTGFTAGPVQDLGDKKRWTWDYHNDTPVTLESDAVAESDFGPRLVMTSFPDYAAVAKAYGERSEPSAAVTPEITAMAGEITKGITDRRAQARAIYDWVSSHIAYVQIVLGAGGFTPHLAKDVLANRFGDCKDHTVLLEALLKAKGIASTPVLIRAGIMAYKLSSAPSPHAFDHVITYLPEFNLYVDSTAGIAPFGVL
ncbi:MAG: DUF3857 domain-containing transglutaminase family protein, partial [Alphaproteobacteria bacterium]|nr:DUF3857 domain-containing transglutaminase family protein [Alphaproteobacteria bacterium]